MTTHHEYSRDDWTPMFSGAMKELKNTRGAVASAVVFLSGYGAKSYNDGLKPIADRLGVEKSTVSLALSWLVENGYLILRTKNLPEKAVEILRSKLPRNFWTNGQECEWCKSKALRLHNHHYPIKKADGGTETVMVCPDCHDAFHCLVDGNGYKPTYKLLDLINLYERMPE